MNDFKNVAQKAAKKVIQHLVYQEAMEWPPNSPYLLYQPSRPKYTPFKDDGGSINKSGATDSCEK